MHRRFARRANEFSKIRMTDQFNKSLLRPDGLDRLIVAGFKNKDSRKRLRHRWEIPCCGLGTLLETGVNAIERFRRVVELGGGFRIELELRISRRDEER